DGIPTFQPTRLALPETPPDALRHDWLVGIRDLDPMGHVNNATYLDVLDEALAGHRDALTGPRPPVRYEVEFLRPALPRRRVSVDHWTGGGSTCARYADPEGMELARARAHAG